jgi:SAM-dependent methyltransferase
MSHSVAISDATIVCSLGMHRSGTSLTTRILNLLGVYLEPEEHLMGPNWINPKGFWEHQLLTNINNEIFARLGGSWHELPAFPWHWEDAPELADLRQQAQTLIETNFGVAKLWGWKDPRTCLTLPFWQRLLPPMRYVIALRNPVDVAHSLEHACSFEKGINLWLAYVKATLEHTAGQPRLFIFYDDLMADWRCELQRLSRFLGRPELAEQADIQKAVEEFIDEELHHHHTSLLDTLDKARLSFPAKALYMTLRLYVSLKQAEPGGQNHDDPTFQKALDFLSLYALEAQTDRDLLRTQVMDLEKQVVDMEQFEKGSLNMGKQHRTNTGKFSMHKLKEQLDQKVINIISEIAPEDRMYKGDRDHYFNVGQTALWCIKLVMLAAGKEDLKSILDLPCGHGRVLRALKSAFPEARLTACDIDRDGVDFCTRVFGATPIYSEERPDQIQINDKFDLIWCGSLLTHLDSDNWMGFLNLFSSLLVPYGILIFSTHGRCVAERLRINRSTYGLTQEGVKSLLESFDTNKFSYQANSSTSNYGFSLSSPSWVCAQLEKVPGLRLLNYIEMGWDKHHDIVACVRVKG